MAKIDIKAMFFSKGFCTLLLLSVNNDGCKWLVGNMAPAAVSPHPMLHTEKR